MNTSKSRLAATRAKIDDRGKRVAAIAASGKCPACGSSLRRDASSIGHWQCERYGAGCLFHTSHME